MRRLFFLLLLLASVASARKHHGKRDPLPPLCPPAIYCVMSDDGVTMICDEVIVVGCPLPL